MAKNKTKWEKEDCYSMMREHKKKEPIFFFDEKYINISFIGKRDTIEKVDNNWEKNNKQLHTPLLNEPESLAINLCLHIKILGFLFLGSSNPI